MERKILFITLLISIKLYSQNVNQGFIVEENKNIDVEFLNFDIPLRIDKVDSQNKIDYSKIEGLLQSFFSATNKQWALSEYLDKNVKLVRDDEHFKAIKKLGKQNYIQLEMIYKFDYLAHKMAYVKYSFINEKIPFPIIGIMSIENLKNRWYISNLLNQGAIQSILSRTSPDFLKDFFNGTSSNPQHNEFIQKNKNKFGIVDILSFYKNISKLKEDNLAFYKEITDQRLIVEKTEFRNAKYKSIPSIIKFKISQPFVYDNFQMFEYSKSENNLTKLDKRSEKYSTKPEYLIIDEKEPTDLLANIKITIENENYYLIKFQKSEKKTVQVIKNTNGVFSLFNSKDFNKVIDLLLLTKASYLKNMLSNQDLLIQKYITGSDDGVNIDLIHDYVVSNKSSLSKFLDN